MKCLILLTLAFTQAACQNVNHQTINETTQKDSTMDIFDKERFNAGQIEGEFTFVLDDSTEVRQWVSAPTHYVEQQMKPNSPYTSYKEYHYGSGFLKISGRLFYDFPTGNWLEYDDRGSRIAETNHDARYAFSLQDLDKKMQTLNVNIMLKQNGVEVLRTDAGDPKYTVLYPINKLNPYDVNQLIIDGGTGETLETSTVKRRN